MARKRQKVNGYYVLVAILFILIAFLMISLYYPNNGVGKFVDCSLRESLMVVPECKESVGPGYGSDPFTGNPYNGPCTSNAQCGACQDCDTSNGLCYMRCSVSECAASVYECGEGTCSSGSCPGE